MSDVVKKPQPAEEAAFWFARLRSGRAGSRDRRKFERWRKSSAENERSFAAAAAVWELAGDAAIDEAVLAMRREALAAAPAAAHRSRWTYVALAASVFLAVCIGVLVYPNLVQDRGDAAMSADAGYPRVYETTVGQRSTAILRDGSVVDLNTDTRIEVQYDRAERRIVLHRGEALFEVAEDEGRPFVVEADDHRITALGTSFDVRRSGDEVQVTLLEGKVTVERERGLLGEGEVQALEPGQQLVAVAEQPFRIETADLKRVVSWRDGLLIFTDEPLGEVVEEINRYSTRKVVLGADAMKELRIGGIFRSGSVDGFTAALESAFPLTGRIDERQNVIVLEWSAQASDRDRKLVDQP